MQELFEPKQYFSVHCNVPVSARWNHGSSLAQVHQKNQNSSYSVMGRKKTGKFKTDDEGHQHYPFSH